MEIIRKLRQYQVLYLRAKKADRFLDKMRPAYKALGINIGQRRNLYRISLSLIKSMIDIGRLAILILNKEINNYSAVLISPEINIYQDGKEIFLKNYQNYEALKDVLIFTRSTRGGKNSYHQRSFDLTLLYTVFMFLGIITRYISFGKIKNRHYAILSVALMAKYLMRTKKKLFVSDWNNPFSVGFIIASKAMKIEAIELQHGIIHRNHPGYNTLSNHGKSFICDKLIFWSLPQDVSFLDNIYAPHDRIPYITKGAIPEATKEIDKYIDILITLQDSNTLEFLGAVAPALKAIRYKSILIRPRGFLKYHARKFLDTELDFVRVSNEGLFEEAAARSKIHISHSSTTLIEAPEYVQTNICFDFDGVACHRSPQIQELIETDSVVYTTSVEELVNIINS